jgi:hypothetical protein
MPGRPARNDLVTGQLLKTGQRAQRVVIIVDNGDLHRRAVWRCSYGAFG